MTAALFALWLCFFAVPAFAQDSQGQNDQGQNNNDQGENYQGAPAPLLGVGIPVILAVGGVLLGRHLLRRKH
jgi:hypothetical protein